MSPLMTILRGLPASGKSRLADVLVRAGKGKTVRVCLDEIRKITSGTKNVKETEENMIRTALQRQENVVVDSTNLTEERLDKLKSIAMDCGARVRISTLNVKPSECVKRDSLREDKVGRAAIYSYYHKYMK